jgi:hypothetical protein
MGKAEIWEKQRYLGWVGISKGICREIEDIYPL